MTKFKKKYKYPIFGPLLPKFVWKWIFHKNRAPQLFSIFCPLASSKKSEKTNEPISKITLN